jgi:hypothetical protein
MDQQGGAQQGGATGGANAGGPNDARQRLPGFSWLHNLLYKASCG